MQWNQYHYMRIQVNILKHVTVLLSYDVASGSDRTSFNNIDTPLVVYRFMYVSK